VADGLTQAKVDELVGLTQSGQIGWCRLSGIPEWSYWVIRNGDILSVSRLWGVRYIAITRADFVVMGEWKSWIGMRPKAKAVDRMHAAVKQHCAARGHDGG
jgi:hypothetical protein